MNRRRGEERAAGELPDGKIHWPQRPSKACLLPAAAGGRPWRFHDGVLAVRHALGEGPERFGELLPPPILLGQSFNPIMHIHHILPKFEGFTFIANR
jgi:hypothetical protein